MFEFCLCALRWFVKVLDEASNTDFLEALDVLDVREVVYDIFSVLPALALVSNFNTFAKITFVLRVYSCLFVSKIHGTQNHKTHDLEFRVYSCLFVSIRVYSCLVSKIMSKINDSCLFRVYNMSIRVYSCLFPSVSKICLLFTRKTHA